jgi:hypothetical protein
MSRVRPRRFCDPPPQVRSSPDRKRAQPLPPLPVLTPPPCTAADVKAVTRQEAPKYKRGFPARKVGRLQRPQGRHGGDGARGIGGEGPPPTYPARAQCFDAAADSTPPSEEDFVFYFVRRCDGAGPNSRAEVALRARQTSNLWSRSLRFARTPPPGPARAARRSARRSNAASVAPQVRAGKSLRFGAVRMCARTGLLNLKEFNFERESKALATAVALLRRDHPMEVVCGFSPLIFRHGSF